MPSISENASEMPGPNNSLNGFNNVLQHINLNNNQSSLNDIIRHVSSPFGLPNLIENIQNSGGSG